MKKIKISDSDLRLLILLVALIVVAAAYFLGFNTYNNKAAKIEEQNETREVRLNELKDMVARQGQVEQETKTMQKRIQEITANYPDKITTEKIISIVQQLEDNTEIKVSQMSFVLNNQFSEVANAEMATQDANSSTTEDASTSETAGTTEATTTTETTTETMTPKNYYGSFASLTMDYEAEYDVLKKAIDEINSSDDKLSISALTATYSNEDNKLTGSMIVYFYTLDGTEKQYVAPSVSGQKGVNNIFRSGSSAQSQQTEEDE